MGKIIVFEQTPCSWVFRFSLIQYIYTTEILYRAGNWENAGESGQWIYKRGCSSTEVCNIGFPSFMHEKASKCYVITYVNKVGFSVSMV